MCEFIQLATCTVSPPWFFRLEVMKEEFMIQLWGKAAWILRSLPNPRVLWSHKNAACGQTFAVTSLYTTLTFSWGQIYMALFFPRTFLYASYLTLTSLEFFSQDCAFQTWRGRSRQVFRMVISAGQQIWNFNTWLRNVSDLFLCPLSFHCYSYHLLLPSLFP